MEALSVRHEIDIDAPIARVWSFVGTAAGMSAWWAAEVTLDARVGGHYEERGTHGSFSSPLIGRVVIYAPPHTTAYSTRDRHADGSEWPADTTVAITLTET